MGIARNSQSSKEDLTVNLVIAFCAALMADSMMLVGNLVVGIPLFIPIFVLFWAHHLAFGVIVYFCVNSMAKHFLPKTILFTAIILPGPFLLVAIGLLFIMQSKPVEFVLTQAAIAGVGVATGGVGAAVGEIAGGAAGAAETAGVAAKTAEGIGVAAKTAGGLAEGAAGTARKTISTGEKIAGYAERAKDAGLKYAGRRMRGDLSDLREGEGENNVSPEALGEEPPLDEKIFQEDFSLPNDNYFENSSEDGLAEDEKAGRVGGKNVILKDDGTVDLSRRSNENKQS